METFFDYRTIISDVFNIFIRNILQYVENNGLTNKNYFYISFITNYDGVEISQDILKKYPEEMMIILQHQFHNLKVKEYGFEVTLSFNSVLERLVVPFKSIIFFSDPTANFQMQRKIDKNNKSMSDFSISFHPTHDFIETSNKIDLLVDIPCYNTNFSEIDKQKEIHKDNDMKEAFNIYHQIWDGIFSQINSFVSDYGVNSSYIVDTKYLDDENKVIDIKRYLNLGDNNIKE